MIWLPISIGFLIEVHLIHSLFSKNVINILTVYLEELEFQRLSNCIKFTFKICTRKLLAFAQSVSVIFHVKLLYSSSSLIPISLYSFYTIWASYTWFVSFHITTIVFQKTRMKVRKFNLSWSNLSALGTLIICFACSMYEGYRRIIVEDCARIGRI